MQSSAWIQCRSEDGYEHRALVLKDEAGAVVAGAVVGRWTLDDGSAFHYVQEGPLLPQEPELREQVASTLAQSLLKIVRADPAPVSHVRLEPRNASDAGLWSQFGFAVSALDDRFVEPRHSRWIHLQASEVDRLAAMKPKGRYNVQLARRHGVTVREDASAAGFKTFYAIREDTAARQGLSSRSQAYFSCIRKAFGPAARVFIAELDGHALAAALVLVFGQRATYFYGGSRTQHREVMAPYLLHHEIMNVLAAEGINTYDLWGTSPPGCDGHAFDGISAFKRKLGGVDIALAPTLDLVIDAQAYRAHAQREATPVLQPSARVEPALTQEVSP